ncbi:MAG: hypothetical protein K6A23_03940, partial [Butyrivibrio sp.]|nr:hypothetical protein [Butyrivibrio sp.]
TKDLTEDEKKDVLIFASANNVLGTGTVQSYFLTDIVNANNLAGSGDFIKISEEELLNYNPEKLIIAGHDGYISPETVKAGKSCGINWGNVKDLEAIKNDEFICLGYEEWRDTIETPVTLLKMAKLVYPELFEDIDIEKEEKELYMNCYGLTEDQVAGALDAQHYTGQLEEAK